MTKSYDEMTWEERYEGYLLYKYPCPDCGAASFEDCRREDSVIINAHADRRWASTIGETRRIAEERGYDFEKYAHSLLRPEREYPEEWLKKEDVHELS